MADGFGTKPQFDTADFSSSSNACAFCKTAISAGYYKVQGKLTCANCFQKIKNSIPQDSHAAFVKAVIFGSVAAVVGMAAYAAIVIKTGWTIGYLALGVGYIIAKAMKMGSEGVGGRRYQMTAAALTYAAISVSAVIIFAFTIGPKAADKGAFALRLLMLGLASPILELIESPANGLIGLIILFVGIRIAWSMTAGARNISIEGPY